MEDSLTQDALDGAAEGERRRRRRSTASSRWRAQRVEVKLRILMALALMLYLAIGLARDWRQSEAYGGVAIGMTADGVRAAKGHATRVDPAGNWTYEEGGTVHTVSFADGKVSGSSCRLADPGLIACPAAFGISAGSSADELLVRLGPADRIVSNRSGWDLFYDGLGYRFTLEGATVVTIEHSAPGKPEQLLRDSLWQLLP